MITKDRTNIDWKSIWERKGNEESENLSTMNGWMNTGIPNRSSNSLLHGVQPELYPAYIAKEIQNILGFNKDSNVLEVGCGGGALAQFYDCNYTGIDYAESLIKRHKEILKNSNVYVAEADDLPFKDNSFDYVFSNSVFHYFPNKDYTNKAIAEMKRVAIKGIFIGDLPIVSHDESHQLFSMDDFCDWEIIPGWYTDKRFNAYQILTWSGER